MPQSSAGQGLEMLLMIVGVAGTIQESVCS
jgi:hypothetical protein